MPRRSPLPPELLARFSVADALALGVSPSRLNSRELRRPFNGVRSTVVPSGATLLDACLDYAPRLAPCQFFSHETVFGLIGAPTPGWPYRPLVHVSAHRPAREPRTAGIVGHRLQVREPATRVLANGLRVEDPVRAWRQAGTLWPLDALVAAADFLISDRGRRPLASLDELVAEVNAMGDVRGGILRTALLHSREGVRSSRETDLRLRLLAAGLPEPEINWTLRDHRGSFVAELDLAYPRWRVAPEYDGRVHAENAAQFEKDADRWDRIRAVGWEHVRILNHHMRGDGGAAVAKVRDALIRAGWRPGQSSRVPLSFE
ncbi:hypothetical protein R8Z57_10270 [Microbacterium sp. M3]|uniref:DUF559 domain-containing protein n=1 Tax=Microbacterium arthrosphaerae TaxID=792652 RepID=A0ABU4H1E8_9MICO|nr:MULTISPECIES: hypothetical protein [Microbacterium]MDW4573153.1 hypothetical protein [Microbacterium arthrosphaerae]MDW7607008.1 hypothetical protein [Microbacterium sp. M3]